MSRKFSDYIRFTRKPSSSRRRNLKSFTKDEDGTAAIEFALVGVPFFMLMFAIIEISLVFMAEININYATYLSARKVRTLNPAIQTEDDFKQDVCNTVIFLPNCMAKLKLEVLTYGPDETITYTDLITGGDRADDPDTSIWTNSNSGDIVTVRTIYEWDLIGKIPLVGFGNLNNGNRLVVGFAAFKNE